MTTLAKPVYIIGTDALACYLAARFQDAGGQAVIVAAPAEIKSLGTNGVSIMGRNGIPCIGFGPGAEAQAHAPNEKTWKQDLVTCAAVYAALPNCYCE